MSVSEQSSFRLREQDLQGKVAVITGATRGLGRAFTINLASRGCSVLGTGTSPQSLSSLIALEEKFKQLYKDANSNRISKIVGIVVNIYDSNTPQILARGLQDNFAGQVDIFINNAADPRPGTIGELTAEEVQQSLIANIQTPVMIVEEFVKHKMFQRESRIIYISSIRTRQPWSMQLMYSAGKSAGESLTKTWAEAFGGKEEKYSFMSGTTANAVTVGLTQTDSVLQCPPEALEGFKKEFLPLQSLPKFGEPEDVADVVGLLCSRDARWITGCVVSASGGGVKIG